MTKDSSVRSGGVACSLCGNRMTFGAASPGMRASHDEAEMVEMMAILTGWSRSEGQWVCGRHDGTPKGNSDVQG